MITFEVKPFSAFTPLELYQVLKMRIDVFVVEQNCPYSECDDKDIAADTLHVIGKNPTGQMVAYARLLAPGISYEGSSIGRVMVLASARGHGYANALVNFCCVTNHQQWPNHPIEIGAQTYLVEMYQQHGFAKAGQPYIEDGIPHIDMIKAPITA